MPTFDKNFRSHSWHFHYYESNIRETSKKMLLIYIHIHTLIILVSSIFDVNISYRKHHVVGI
jgi:hypothetical protein